MWSAGVPLLAILAACVSAHSSPAGISEFSVRQANSTDDDPCNNLCSNYSSLEDQCDHPSCGCTVSFLQAQGACLLCYAHNDSDAAAVQLLQEGEMDQCRMHGIHLNFRLPLPPGAAAIVRKFDTRSTELRREQSAFLALQVTGGHIGLVLFLLHGVLSRRVNRDPIVFNFCLTWIFSSIAFSLLLYRGTDGNTVVNSLGVVDPPKCLAQSALISGAQVMTACSTMALVIRLWLCLRATIHGDIGPKHVRLKSISLLVSPYVLFFTFAVPAIFLGQKSLMIADAQFENAVPTNFYCMVMDKNGYLPALYGVTLTLLILTVVFDGLILRMLYWHWRTFRNSKVESCISLSTLLRVVAFSIYRIVVAVAYGTILREPPKSSTLGEDMGAVDTLVVLFGVPQWVDMLQAATPLVAFLVLGTSRDTIAALWFWKKKKRAVVSAPAPVLDDDEEELEEEKKSSKV